MVAEPHFVTECRERGRPFFAKGQTLLQTIAVYVSGHGFGHASRDIEVIKALFTQRPDLRVVVRTTAPKWLFERTLRAPTTSGDTARAAVQYVPVETDTGIAQIDSLRLDVDETVRRAREFMIDFDRRADDEAEFLVRARVGLVVADIPPLGIAAGQRAGIPAVAFGNFTWDWIYAAYAGADGVAAAMGAAYARADLALRLPMHGGFSTVSRIVDLPFVARRSARAPEDTRQALGLPLDERLVLVSFGGYGLDGLDLDALSRLAGYTVVVTGRVPLADPPPELAGRRRGSLWPFDEKTMYRAGYRYEDLVRTVDVVVTKPGYGIIAECLANDTALLYTSRGAFVEYDVLVDTVPRFLRAAFIGHADLFAGRWAPHLDALLSQAEPPERPATDGAEIAADRLLAMI